MFLKKAILSVIKLVSPVFFDQCYLAGKDFRNLDKGWRWVANGIWRQKILGFNKSVPWPINHTTVISNFRNIEFDLDDLNNFQSPGCYFQNFSAKIIIGKGSYIAPNVGLITSNHDINDLERHVEGKDIVLGKKCWVGMNSIILPGVHLGDRTIVGAGSVVTKSFHEGNVVIAGNPAKVLRTIQKDA